MNLPIFDDHGYVTAGSIKELTHFQMKSAIAEKIAETKQMIKDKEAEIVRIKRYLSCLEHSDRTIWLSYQDDRPPERKVLG